MATSIHNRRGPEPSVGMGPVRRCRTWVVVRHHASLMTLDTTSPSTEFANTSWLIVTCGGPIGTDGMARGIGRQMAPCIRPRDRSDAAPHGLMGSCQPRPLMVRRHEGWPLSMTRAAARPGAYAPRTPLSPGPQLSARRAHGAPGETPRGPTHSGSPPLNVGRQ
jgi:hypothetical protein